MKVYRDIEGSAYVYYIQHEDMTVLWYPEMEWRHRPVETPKGRLLAEGTAAEVNREVREFLPADLLSWLKRYYGIGVEGGANSWRI